MNQHGDIRISAYLKHFIHKNQKCVTSFFCLTQCYILCAHSIVTNLIAFEVGPSARSKTLLTAEALEL